jgi:RimJ/RimL family protein N-acetyltransferase
MPDLPKPILGDITALTITTPDLEQSLAYYQRLGFTEVFRADWPFPWIQVSDEVLLIMLRKDATPYLALTYYVKQIDAVVADLTKKGIEFVQKAKKTDALKRYLIQSPDGLNISLVGMIDGFYQPAGPGMLHMQPKDYFKPEKYVNKTCGMFGELAHPVGDLEQSLEFWKLLGFSAVSKFTTPYPWAIVSDGLGIVGLHQTTKFAYPAITYFAADMKEKTDKLKAAGLAEYTERGPSDIVLTTPEQQHINLFSLGMQKQVSKKQKHVINFPTLETKRLLLKELGPEEMKEIFTTCSDEEIMGLYGYTTNEEVETEKNKFELGMTTYRTSFKSFLIEEKSSGNIIGRSGFHNWYDMHKRAELGYALSDESAKRKGYTTEAVRAIIKYGFEEMDLNRIEAFVGPHNTPSLKIVRGLGFTEEGTLREHFCKNGVMEDSVCFSLLKKEYDLRKRQWKY